MSSRTRQRKSASVANRSPSIGRVRAAGKLNLPEELTGLPDEATGTDNIYELTDDDIRVVDEYSIVHQRGRFWRAQIRLHKEGGDGKTLKKSLEDDFINGTALSAFVASISFACVLQNVEFEKEGAFFKQLASMKIDESTASEAFFEFLSHKNNVLTYFGNMDLILVLLYCLCFLFFFPGAELHRTFIIWRLLEQMGLVRRTRIAKQSTTLWNNHTKYQVIQLTIIFFVLCVIRFYVEWVPEKATEVIVIAGKVGFAGFFMTAIFRTVRSIYASLYKHSMFLQTSPGHIISAMRGFLEKDELAGREWWHLSPAFDGVLYNILGATVGVLFQYGFIPSLLPLGVWWFLKFEIDSMRAVWDDTMVNKIYNKFAPGWTEIPSECKICLCKWDFPQELRYSDAQLGQLDKGEREKVVRLRARFLEDKFREHCESRAHLHNSDEAWKKRGRSRSAPRHRGLLSP